MVEEMRAHQDIHDHGCAWGRVNRTTIEHTVRDMNNLQKKLDTILLLLLAQMLTFVVAVFWFFISKAIP